MKLTRNNSADLAFAQSCLMSGAITQSEFRQWLYHLIEYQDDLPSYVFDLLDLEDIREIFRGANGPIGFYPSSDLSTEEKDAIFGIAYKRGYYDRQIDYELSVCREAALEALTNSPNIEVRFRAMFPFIDY